MLTFYYETDKEMASYLLTRKIPMWRNQTLLDVAGEIELKSFIVHPASQNVVSSKAWSGKVFSILFDLHELKKNCACRKKCLPHYYHYITSKLLRKKYTIIHDDIYCIYTCYLMVGLIFQGVVFEFKSSSSNIS